LVGERGKKIRLVKLGKPPDHFPASFDKMIPVSQLKLDPYNVREEEPTDDLVESIKKTGFREPVIVRPDRLNEHERDSFFVTDGWQRVQAGARAGWTKIPCSIHKTALEAMKEANRASIKREWTKYQRIKHYRNYFDACIEEGMDYGEAIDNTVKDNPADEQTVLKYLRITRLPPIVQVLLKKPENRTLQEWTQLEKINYNIRMSQKPLGIGIADTIAQYIRNFSPRKQSEVAVGVLGMKEPKAKKAIRLISKSPEADPADIIYSVEKGYSIGQVLQIGSLIVNPALKNYLQVYCSTRRVTPKDIVRKLLKEWSLMSETNSVYIPSAGTKGEIAKVSFKVGRHIVQIIQYAGYPVINVEGMPSVFFSQREVKERAWNQNVRLPSYLKEFLNSLKIQLRPDES
jgi:ParB/RepB/Spo0J family partition protein